MFSFDFCCTDNINNKAATLLLFFFKYFFSRQDTGVRNYRHKVEHKTKIKPCQNQTFFLMHKKNYTTFLSENPQGL